MTPPAAVLARARGITGNNEAPAAPGAARLASLERQSDGDPRDAFQQAPGP
jgi:hypothetical protein